MKSYDAESSSSSTPTVVFYSDFSINTAQFQLTFMKDMQGILVSGAWVNQKTRFELNDLTDYFEIELPEFLDFEFVLEMVKLKYFTKDSSLSFAATIKNFGKLTLATTKVEKQKKRNYKMDLEFNRTLELAQLPIIGNFCDAGDGFIFEQIGVNYKPSDALVFSFLSKLLIKRHSLNLNIDYAESLKSKPVREANLSPTRTASQPATASPASSRKKIYWLDINKGFSVLYFSKIGASLNKSELTLYLDASFTIAMLRIDFYELYVSASLKKLTDVQFGLNGLMVSMEKPSFSLSGGLYKSPEEEMMYNGALSLRVGSYGFQALGSYGQMPGSNEKTFFAYLMLSLPLGGPDFFFVTGLALGFGVNRSIKLPGIEGVKDFPFVAAAMGTSSKLKADTPPSVALSALSKTIVPDSGQYFLSAGIRFLTYGVLESFALLNIEMGKRLVISMLGLSNASMPPKVTGSPPIVQAELALKMVFDPQQGECMMIAALTDRSFILDPACKLTGGFAIGFWFKGEYSGDFIVTLGGCHHPEFQNVHYPAIAPLGISWIISDQISIKGEAYFALTPTCLMAGVNAQLLFERGNLRAWFCASADFILKWKPFYYRATAQVSIGASYRVSIFGIGKTFKVEIGAGLELWGPEFSGNVRINWFIISFTIGFGAGNKALPAPIQWNEFADSFLPGAKPQPAATVRAANATTAVKLNTVHMAGGLIAEYTDQRGQKAYVLDGFNAAFTVEYKMPCTELHLNGQSLLTDNVQLGIVPMGLADVKMQQQVNVMRKEDQQRVEGFTGTTQLRNVPAALWATKAPQMSDSLIRDMPVGMAVNMSEPCIVRHILPSQGAYDEAVLDERESMTRTAIYTAPIFADGVQYPSDEQTVVQQLQNTIGNHAVRDTLLADTAAEFGTWEQEQLHRLASHPKAVLFAAPELRTIGAMYAS
ncbi:DUF6603 domain-containing protein [Paenibacillus campi]|uniref:DUF6603 domain-containing protein n=1 Tax=Paenibacillus campi TaxID=3106031 RepID=UPI002AFF1F13|nr:DUF6603 domain-containing protein [Paenibacillus sp. SGZ-1014]